MNLSELLNQITKLQKDSEDLQEVKKILHNDGTTRVVDQVKYLQENTSVNNIYKLKERLARINDYINHIEGSFEEQSNDVANALGYLEDVQSECDYIYDARNLVDDLFTDLTNLDSDLHKEEEPVAKKTTAKKTTPFSDDDKNSLIDVISDGNSQQ